MRPTQAMVFVASLSFNACLGHPRFQTHALLTRLQTDSDF